jgi:hypothetical protein
MIELQRRTQQIIRQLAAMTRSVGLNRQFREVERAIDQLPFASRPALAALTMREYAGTAKRTSPHRLRVRAFAEIQSPNPQVRLRGIATWLAMAYHETRNSNSELHAQLMSTLRAFKEIAPPSAADSDDAEETVA